MATNFARFFDHAGILEQQVDKLAPVHVVLKMGLLFRNQQTVATRRTTLWGYGVISLRLSFVMVR